MRVGPYQASGKPRYASLTPSSPRKSRAHLVPESAQSWRRHRTCALAFLGLDQVLVGSAELSMEHARSRELLSLGITEARKYTTTVHDELRPDTPYRSGMLLLALPSREPRPLKAQKRVSRSEKPPPCCL